MVVRKFRFKMKGKDVELDVRVCDSVFSQARGLMFRKKSHPLLFVFKNVKKRAIHSFFCKPFYAVWFNGDKIVDERLVSPWKLCIAPKNGFDRLLEIPVDKENFDKMGIKIL